MPTTGLPLYTPTIASLVTKTSTPKTFTSLPVRKLHGKSITCKASSSSSSHSITDFDLYDLLGIDNSCSQSQIKAAYRMLQKRCHPDIAGPSGHDMAIILNEAYSVLSDPNSRLAYDEDQAKIAEVRGYTGKPLYSLWFGSESEERAVFVDEVKCVGCLKCALFAQNTFAIEPVYGRARCVAQWADPEYKIQEAIETCPVDCISIIERSDLAALEFLMAKQPRGNVRVGAGNTVGARVSNIFVDVKKFQTRVVDTKNKAAKQETEPQWKARMSAIQAIRSISNWLHWQSPKAGATNSVSLQYAGQRIAPESTEPDLDKLRNAAAARKQARESSKKRATPLTYLYHDEYWSPLKTLPAPIHNTSSSKPNPKPLRTNTRKETREKDCNIREDQRNPIGLAIPVVTALIAAVKIQSQVAEGTIGGLKEHIGGSWALQLVNSSWLQVTLAGITWYFIGVLMMEAVEALRK